MAGRRAPAYQGTVIVGRRRVWIGERRVSEAAAFVDASRMARHYKDTRAAFLRSGGELGPGRHRPGAIKPSTRKVR